MKQGLKRKRSEAHPLFTLEEQDGILAVEFVGTAQEILGMKLDVFDQLRRLLSMQKNTPSKAIVFTIQPGILTPANIAGILANHGLYSSRGRPGRPSNISSPSDTSDFIREMNTAKTLIQDIRSIDALVIVTLNGEMPLSLFGTALACDYRIAAEGFMLVNRIPQTGFTPLAGLPWFLSRILGPAKARDILMNRETISACEALELGLIDRLVPKDRLKQESISEAKKVAALPWGCRVGLKRAMTFADEPLAEYLEHESDIFKMSLEQIISSSKSAVSSLENIT